MPNILGMINTMSYNDTDRRPKDWNQMIFYDDPNPQAPLTALLGLAGNGRPTTDPEFYYWTHRLPNQRGNITGVYTDALSTAYNPANADACLDVDDLVYLKCAEADAKIIRVGHNVLLRDEAYPLLNFGIVGRVTNRVLNGANSYLVVKLHQPDTWHTDRSFLEGGRTSPSSSLIFWITGSSYAEGTGAPTAISYEPVKGYNMTQIFKTRTSITRTAKQTKLRTGEIMRQIKMEALKLHSIEQEKAYFFGVRKLEQDSEGRPLRHTSGLIHYADVNGNEMIPRVAFTGDWLATDATGGFEWLWGVNGQLEQLFRFGSSKRLAFCGSSVISAINLLAKTFTDITVTVKETAFGFQYNELVSPFGTLMLKMHPLFSYEPTMRKTMVIIDPENITQRTIQATTFKENIQANDADAQDDMFYTEAGLEVHFPDTFRVLHNIG